MTGQKDLSVSEESVTYTVDGRFEITSFQVGSLSTFFSGGLYIPSGCWGFQPSTVDNSFRYDANDNSGKKNDQTKIEKHIISMATAQPLKMLIASL